MKSEERQLATAAENEYTRFKREMCIGQLLAGKHCLIIGATGSGKTFFMANIANRFLSRVIFVNPQLEEVITKVCDVSTGSTDEVIEAITEGAKAVEFIPAEDVDAAIDELAELRTDIFAIAQELRKENRIEDGAFWLDFILDEAQLYAWKGSRNDVDNFATRGRHWGVRCWFLTQRPQNLSSTIINNVQYQVIFRTGSYESVYFKTYKIPIERYASWLRRDYHYILWDGIDAQECNPLGGETDGRKGV